MSTVPRNVPGWRDQYMVLIHGARAQLLCKRMLPHLKVKHEQATLLLTFPGEHRKAPGKKLDPQVNLARLTLRERINSMNVRGSL